MRIWSKVLIPVLPNKQLMAMRYELGDMIKQHPNIKHSLVKFANNYDVIFLYYYFMDVCKEMSNRGINMSESYNDEISNVVCSKSGNQKTQTFNEDNARYLKQCLYNLEEKATRDMMSKEEWLKIYDVFKNFTDLWDGVK